MSKRWDDLPEQIARAICKAAGLNPDEVTHGTWATGSDKPMQVYERRWQQSLGAAHAALNEIAARGPTGPAALKDWVEGRAGWQPIETAPKDGTFVDLLVVYSTTSKRVPECFWDNDQNLWVPWDRIAPYPYPIRLPITHWRPLPSPPVEAAIPAAPDGDVK